MLPDVFFIRLFPAGHETSPTLTCVLSCICSEHEEGIIQPNTPRPSSLQPDLHEVVAMEQLAN